jgi:hypothetical protein
MSQSNDTPSRPSAEVVAELRRANVASLSLAEIQSIMEIAVLAYGGMLDDEREVGPILPPGTNVTATDAARAASGLLGAVNLEVFELALWETWGGRPWSSDKDMPRAAQKNLGGLTHG